jgi:excisionase family DNA binding protein
MAMITPDQEFLDPQRAAQFCSVSLTTLRRWITTGKLRVFKPAERKILISRSELRAMIEASAVQRAE